MSVKQGKQDTVAVIVVHAVVVGVRKFINRQLAKARHLRTNVLRRTRVIVVRIVALRMVQDTVPKRRCVARDIVIRVSVMPLVLAIERVSVPQDIVDHLVNVTELGDKVQQLMDYDFCFDCCTPSISDFHLQYLISRISKTSNRT
eukprot:TRINITY_DN6938_c1_g1_i12.p7 TRINITY_DN6938_c1_g1~~TRINITY_DN6938_c1_g1_i12.p7  ORF type:complete len:145 (-),score=5.97 TRINITY_DN6938_c1_g1_i12:1543-1977(-)